MREPRVRPLTPAYITVNGGACSQRSIIWTGLMWHEAYLGTDGNDLRVPWCHPNDTPEPSSLAVYRVRSRDERFRFERARNGLWVLREVVAP